MTPHDEAGASTRFERFAVGRLPLLCHRLVALVDADSVISE